jgi:pimeloyl-ACP methyl ester carboxylesterase
MRVIDEGQGQPLLLIHGFPLDLTMWTDQAALAAELRLIRFDLPGFGAGPPAERFDQSMAGYADAACAALDQVGVKRAAACGLSMGGYILFELWRRHPERISALVFADTRAEADTPEGRQARLDGIAKLRGGRRQELLEGYLPKLLAPASLARPAIVERVRAMSSAASDAGIVAALQAMHDRPDSTPVLATIRVPTLIVVGAEDALTPPAMARVIHRGVAGSKLVEIPGAGHLAPLENPEAFNRALRAHLGHDLGT